MPNCGRRSNDGTVEKPQEAIRSAPAENLPGLYLLAHKHFTVPTPFQEILPHPLNNLPFTQPQNP